MSLISLSDPRISLRPCQIEDESFLRKVYASTRQDEMSLVDWTQLQKDAFLDMQFSAQRQYYLQYYPTAEYHIIQLEGLDIGRLIVDHQPDLILLMDITLLPAYRRQGIGTGLIRALMLAGLRACQPIQLHVEIFNPALHLYTRLGFEKVREVGIYYEMEWCPRF